MFINYNKFNLNAFNDDIKHLHDNNMPITKYNSILWRAFNKHIPDERVHVEKSLADLFEFQTQIFLKFSMSKHKNWALMFPTSSILEAFFSFAPIEFQKLTVEKHSNWAKWNLFSPSLFDLASRVFREKLMVFKLKFELIFFCMCALWSPSSLSLQLTFSFFLPSLDHASQWVLNEIFQQ